jgi:hypothetical protein
MGQSYRIRTELGVNKTINVQLDQEFEQLEILSLKLQQEDVYIRSCAEYGVIVGRVTANNGFGLPNARVSIFIPITTVDESNPIISSIYPYKSPSDKNEDGYRYNLLPYEKSYLVHAATGTLPSRLDALTGTTAVEIFDKYYKFTSKTNDSGDYMIMGVPLGFQTVVMDVDLSDIGEFSLTPQDLIRMGLATEAQVAGNRFRTSTDLNSLPQIINLVKGLEISPLWGDPEICDIAINRLDFDLRDDANVNIQPTSVFMGSIYSTSDAYRVRRSARPKDDMGNLCSLETGPGQILSIRQTIQQDTIGYPILEQYVFEQSGNIIDGDGTWLTELPMNLDYYITNEFGEKVISNDPTIGIPTKGKYRFKIKWSQPTGLAEQTRRPYFLVPNIREYGWINTSLDPNFASNQTMRNNLAGSYYFGLDWSGYTNADAAVNCEDTFYQFDYNKVYTVAGLIDEFKNGAKGRFIGIKEIDSQDCEETTNKFPVNEGFRNFDTIFFIFSIIMQIFQFIGIVVLYTYHIIAYLWDLIISTRVLQVLFKLDPQPFPPIRLPMITYPDCQACECGDENVTQPLNSLPIQSTFLTPISDPARYTDKIFSKIATGAPSSVTNDLNAYTLNMAEAFSTLNSYEQWPSLFKNGKSILRQFQSWNGYSIQPLTIPLGVRINIFNTNNKYYDNINRIKVTFAADSNLGYHYDNTLTILTVPEFTETTPGTLLSFINPTGSTDSNYLWSGQTPGGTIINGINGKLQTNQFVMNVDYADPNNRLNNLTTSYTIPSNPSVTCVNSVTVDVTSLGTISYTDCTTFNVEYTATTLGIQTIYNDDCITLNSLGGTAEYTIVNSGDTCQRYLYPSDIEYYQVLTAITISTTVVNGITYYTIPGASNSTGFLGTLLKTTTVINYKSVSDITNNNQGYIVDNVISNISEAPPYLFDDFQNQKIVILQRGVDPYSPLLTNKYGVGTLFGSTENDPYWTFTASTRVNIPIQKIPTGSTTTVPQHNNQDNIFFQSNFFTPGIPGSTIPGLQYSSFTTSNVGYYGELDGISSNRFVTNPNNYPYNSANYIDKSPTYGIAKGAVCKTAGNDLYSSSVNDLKYDSAEDLSGGAISIVSPQTGIQICTSTNFFGNCNGFVLGIEQQSLTNFSPILLPTLTGSNALSISNPIKNVMRTERLPSSDKLDNPTLLNGSNSLLQQNLRFSVYVIQTEGSVLFVNPGFSTGASQVTPDIEGQLASQNVLASLGTCEKLVGLNCYQGNGVNFGIKPNCSSSDAVENGCYVFVKEPLTDLSKDITNFEEWAYRFRFFYGLCRGVLSQSFTNNWVNGSLYTFPIQVDTFYDKNNKPLPPQFAKELVYFDDKTNNFYYRSSPYLTGTTTSRFIGRPTTGLSKPTNDRNLLFPTTIVNLGMKDSFYEEINYDPSSRGYIMNSLNSTSYSDTSDLVNLFVISRITDANFLQQLLVGTGDNGLNQLFTRPEKRIDGDLAQSMSINSEYGVIPFSPEYYSVYGTSNDPVVILGGLDNPTMGIFFSSTTIDLQNKDFLTPGVIDFRPSNNANAITYPYGIKSQYVPFYQWELNQQSVQSIFGSQYNNWKTNQNVDINTSGIFGYKYQSLDRRNTGTPSYFIGSNTQVSDIYERGYIFNVNPNGSYSYNAGTYPNKFLVSAPYHFYFGVKKGLTALDKFKTKYSIVE